MNKIAKLLPLCGFVIAVALVVLTSSFKTAPKKTHSGATLYYYTYTGPDQSPAQRKLGTNYTNPQTSQVACDGSVNECAVEVSVSGGTPPANISGLSVTHDPTTGIPNGGSDLQQNFLED